MSEQTLSGINGDVIIACDGGYDKLSGVIKPDYLIGDFDSIKKIPLDIELIRFPKDKDYTDGHLGLAKLIDLGCTQVEIYCALGGRPDHYYSNLSLLYFAKTKNVTAKIIDEEYIIELVNGEYKQKLIPNKLFSIVPFFSESHIKYTKGLKFPMKDTILDRIHILAISNEVVSPEVEFYCDGEVLVFREK